ncbi:hypothetical protein ACFSTA_06740 [Ornithinibacillus salinisoli]|uniref:hypothetical protein n=1 Tax=Ornithinibacillus salinisoli TaxID=1848459 RepID=UPI00363C81EF
MQTFLLILLFVSISFLDYRYMIKEKKRKILVIYTIILSVAFVITELHVLGYRLKGLNQFVSYIMDLFV